MGNKSSVPEPPLPRKKFGNVYPEPGEKPRPGYYFGKSGIVYAGEPLTVLPGESGFQKLKYGYLKSNLRVFFRGKVIPGANPATFAVLTRNNVSKISKNPEKNEEFKKLNCVISTDFVGNTKRVYCGTNIIHTE